MRNIRKIILFISTVRSHIAFPTTTSFALPSSTHSLSSILSNKLSPQFCLPALWLSIRVSINSEHGFERFRDNAALYSKANNVNVNIFYDYGLAQVRYMG